MPLFTTLKAIHITTVILTASMFMLRGLWMMQNSPLLQHPVVRVAPHLNDTVLFASALALAFSIGQFPFIDSWLTAKFLALLLYIALGHIALKRGRTRSQRITALVAALLALVYIVGVALCHTPLTCLAA